MNASKILYTETFGEHKSDLNGFGQNAAGKLCIRTAL